MSQVTPTNRPRSAAMTRIVIIGGGPAGYEAALVAAQLGAEVTVVERDGIGGASVLTDCVPSKTPIAPPRAATPVPEATRPGHLGPRGHRPRPARRRPDARGPGPGHRQRAGQEPCHGAVGRHPPAARERG